MAGERKFPDLGIFLLLPDPIYSGGLLSGKIGHLSSCAFLIWDLDGGASSSPDSTSMDLVDTLLVEAF